MLDPALLNSIGDLELVARVTVDGTVAGLHRSPFHGYSAEFSQYRHYRPGDDLKYVDWKLLARTDRVYTKQYRETTNLGAQVVIDASGSMGYRGRDGVTKLEYARLMAAALAYLISMQGDAVGLVVFDSALRQFIASRTGQTHLRSLLVALARMQASGRTNAAPALRRATDLLRRRGLLLVISDLYDEPEEQTETLGSERQESVECELRRAVRIGHQVAVFHVLTRDEIEFPFAGDVELEDAESHDTRIAGPRAATSYRREVGAFLERWRARCTALGIDYTRVTTDMPLDAALRGYLLRQSGSASR